MTDFSFYFHFPLSKFLLSAYCHLFSGLMICFNCLLSKQIGDGWSTQWTDLSWSWWKDLCLKTDNHWHVLKQRHCFIWLQLVLNVHLYLNLTISFYVQGHYLSLTLRYPLWSWDGLDCWQSFYWSWAFSALWIWVCQRFNGIRVIIQYQLHVMVFCFYFTTVSWVPRPNSVRFRLICSS